MLFKKISLVLCLRCYESEEEIGVSLKCNFGYSVEKGLESESGIDDDVAFVVSDFENSQDLIVI